MLTADILKQISALSGLTDEQITAIATASQNDEQAVINTRIGQLHGQYEQDIISLTGATKNPGEKAYDFNKRVLSQYKSVAEDAKSQLAAVNAALEKAKKDLANANQDEALKQQLKDAKTLVQQLQAKVQDDEKAHKAELTRLQAEFQQTRVNSVLDNEISRLAFRKDVSDAVKSAVVSQAKAAVLAKGTAEFTENGSLVFRGADGNLLVNPKNALNPFTAKELLLDTALADLVDTVQQTGGGTKPNPNTPVLPVDISQARTQVEADEIIARQLMQRGLAIDSSEYHDEFAKVRSEANVSSLPIR